MLYSLIFYKLIFFKIKNIFCFRVKDKIYKSGVNFIILFYFKRDVCNKLDVCVLKFIKYF